MSFKKSMGHGKYNELSRFWYLRAKKIKSDVAPGTWHSLDEISRELTVNYILATSKTNRMIWSIAFLWPPTRSRVLICIQIFMLSLNSVTSLDNSNPTINPFQSIWENLFNMHMSLHKFGIPSQQLQSHPSNFALPFFEYAISKRKTGENMRCCSKKVKFASSWANFCS